MGSTLLIACLWGAVFIYWLWTRRPLGGDPVGSFRKELKVLESTTPPRFRPANRLYPSPAVPVNAAQKRPADLRELNPPPPPLTVAARSHTRQGIRRRRQEVVVMLALAALATLFAAVATANVAVVLLQVVIDMVLAVYLYLLVRPPARARRVARPAPPAEVAQGYGGYGDFGSYASLAVSRDN